MKRFATRSLSLVLALVLAMSLALPAAAAGVPVTGVKLDKNTLELVPGKTAQLKATVLPEDAGNAKVTWKSNKEEVATVSKDGEVTAKAKGYADITVSTADGDYTAICRVTVTNDYVSAVTISPAGPENLPVGKQRQLTADVTYAHESKGDQTVTWTSSDPAVATVSDKGLVTAVAKGTADILALSNGKGQNGSAVVGIYRLTVTEAGSSSDSDAMQLSASLVETSAGQFVDTLLHAPTVVVKNGDQDVTDAYQIHYRWTDGNGTEIGTKATQAIQPTTLTAMTVTCSVKAVSKSDSTQIITGACRYQITVYPGTTLGATCTVSGGPLTLDKLTDQEGKLSVLDQLLKGDGDLGIAQPIPGLTHVVFDLGSVTGGEAGTLSAQDGTSYYLEQPDGDPTAALLPQVTFTPQKKGTYGINFLAYGDLVYYGRLEIMVDGQEEPPVGDADRQCDSAGFTFTGADFFQPGDEDPVVSVVFGQPTSGLLLRDLSYGTGTPDEGDKYYTNAASDGKYHVSTLSYLPQADFTGRAALPVTLTTQSGKTRSGAVTVQVNGKTHSDHFTDVTEKDVGRWAANAVDFAQHFSLVSGVSTGRFGPNQSMTRAQLVTILYRAAGSPQMTVTTNFEDLDVGAYYYSAVVWATVKGVVDGTSDTTFSPDKKVTREQIAAILYRYANSRGEDLTVSGNLDAYTDKGQVSAYAAKPMLWAVDRGVISGTTDKTLSPKSSATRAQVVVMLHRYLTQ